MIDINTMSVMIVDDMENMRKSIRGMLKNLDYGKVIRLASNGREGWDLLNNYEIDLAIIDWNMPVMKGIELLGLIRSEKKFRDMPVIMITAEAEREIVSEAAESDIDGYLLKPLTPQSLDERIKSVIRLSNTPHPSTLHMRKARYLEEEKNDIAGAIEEIKQAVRLRPDASRILRKLGQLYSMLGNYETAEKCLIKAVSINKNDAISRYILGEMYLAKDDLPNAIKYYDQAITISPRNISKGVDLGDILMKRGMRNEAINIFSKVISHSGHGLSHSEDVALKCLENGEIDYAKTLLESIVSENPERYDLMMKLGNIYERTMDFETALSYYHKIEENAPDDIAAKLKLASIYIRQKKVFIADRYLNDVLKLEPENQSALDLRRKNL